MLKGVRENWNNFDYLICAVVWAGMVYFCATGVPCVRAADCGTFDMWFFGVVSASVIPAAVFFTGLISVTRSKKQ